MNQTAAVAWGAREPLVLEDVEVNPPQPFEIRIKVVSTSLCRSDLSAWESHVSFSLFLSYPFILFLICHTIYIPINILFDPINDLTKSVTFNYFIFSNY